MTTDFKGGILEQSSLILRGVSGLGKVLPAPRSHLAVVALLSEPSTGEVLGTVSRRQTDGVRWHSWLARPQLALHENDDAPLLCTLNRLWGLTRMWEVRDADGHVVGQLHGRTVQDRFGTTLAVLGPRRGPVLIFLSPDGCPRLRVHRETEGIRIDFAQDPWPNPFLKMLLLGAAVVVCGPTSQGANSR